MFQQEKASTPILIYRSIENSADSAEGDKRDGILSIMAPFFFRADAENSEQSFLIRVAIFYLVFGEDGGDGDKQKIWFTAIKGYRGHTHHLSHH